ncbi:MAG TPA: phosphotransferase [Actinopolymorphaceae bacterium]
MTLELGTLSEDGGHYWDGEPSRWQPLWLRADEVCEAARDRFGVETPARRPEYFGTGLLNQTWRVGDHVLRVSRDERSLEQLEYEHTVTEVLHRELPEICTAVRGVDGLAIQRWNGRLLSLFPYIAGDLGTATPDDVRVRETAAMLGRVHRVSLERLALPQRPGFHAVDVRDQWVWSRLRPMLLAEVRGPEAAECFALFDDEIARLGRWLDELHGSGRPLIRAVVQGDTNPRNLIFSGERIVGVIDWDDCHVDVLAAAVAAEAFWPAVDPETFWRTYLTAGGPLAPEDFELLGGFARLVAFYDLIWADHDGHAGPNALDHIRSVATRLEFLRDRVPDLP